MTEAIKCDICVIGGGSGGLSVAAGAAQMGAKTVLIEEEQDGRRLPQLRLRPLQSPDRCGACRRDRSQ